MPGFNLNNGVNIRIGNLVIFSIGTSQANFNKLTKVAEIDKSITPKKVRDGIDYNGPTFIGTMPNEYPKGTFYSLITADDTVSVYFNCITSGLPRNFSCYGQLIYNI